MSSPWNKNIVPETVSLQEIMLEELAVKFHEKESGRYGVFAFSTYEEIDIPAVVSQHKEQINSDGEFAKMLQLQYDKLETDKITIVPGVPLTSIFSKQSLVNFDFDSDHGDLEDVRDRKEWDKYSTVSKEFDPVPAYNYKCDNKNPVKRNRINTSIFDNQTVCQIISFPWEFVDGAGIEKKNMQKYKSQTYLYPLESIEMPICFGVDDETKVLLFNMFRKQLLKQIYGLISVEEDALVLQAKANPNFPKNSLPTYCTIKVFKTTLGESKRRNKLIADDYRFKGIWRRSGELDIEKIACYWALQEFQILQKLHRAGIPCPRVIIRKRNILVMANPNSNINNEPAPNLRDAEIDLMQLTNAYEQVVHYMKVMFAKCNLIHGDLSATNILWCDNKCYIINLSQFVRQTDDEALFLLYNDCERIYRFFTKKGVSSVATPEELFNDITGHDPRNRFAWAQYQKSLMRKSRAKNKSVI